MSPLLTTFAGDALRAYGFGASSGAPAAFELISTTTLGSSAASISFSSIPTNYTHLQVRIVARSDYATTGDQLKMILNGATTNYWNHWLGFDGSTSTYSTNTGAAAVALMRIGDIPGNTAPASTFGSSIIDIADYQNTNKMKVIRTMNGYLNYAAYQSGPWNAFDGSSLWNTTSAITSIQVAPLNGANLLAGTRVSLYGVKGTL